MSGPVQIDRIHGLVGAERQNAAYALIDGRLNYVAAAQDVGLDRFEWVVLACWHLLERCRVQHHRHARLSPIQPIDVPARLQ